MGRRAPRRRLATVLFTDVVRSTDLARELGDRRWHEALRRHHEIVRRDLKRYGGREIDTAGDGFFAIFPQPTDAVRCAAAIVRDVRELGLEIRAGVHTGEIELDGSQARGIGVHLGARVMATAGAGEIRLSGTTRDLLAGSDILLDDRGMAELKGIEGEVHLFEVAGVDGQPLAPPVDETDAKTRRDAIEPGSGRRRMPLIALGAGIVVTIAIVLFVATRGGGGTAAAPTGPSGGAAPPSPDSLFAVDPDTGDVVRDPIEGVVTNTGGAPRIAVGNGRVWLRSTNVVVVDPKDGSVLETVPSVGTVSAGSSATIEASTAAVWAPAGGGFSGRPSRIERLDPNTYAPLRPITLDSDATVTDAAFDGDDAWVSFSDGTVLELDVSTGKQLAEYRLGGSIDEIEADTDAVWTLDEVAGIVTRLDPSDGHVVETFTVSPNTREIDAGEGGLWMLDVQAGTVTLIDETRNQSGGPIAVGPEPSQLSVGLGAVWVASLDGTLHRVNPLTSRDEQDFDLGAPLSAIAVDPTTRTIWLTVESQG